MRFIFRALVLIACLGLRSGYAADGNRNLAVSTTSSGNRIALVIGNSAYSGAPLANPVNDARDMAGVLRKLGFEVIERTNVSQKDMNRAIAQFGEKLRNDSVALFFFAGHGMQVKGKNYLIPVDAQISTEATVRAETVDVDTVMDQLSVSPLNVVILDACRNNPFERRFRSVGGGLAQMDAPKGSLIAYATAPGKVASDGSGKNGLYTQELLRQIQSPGLTLEAVFKRVRNGVMTASADAQIPWESSSLTGDFFFVPAANSASSSNIDKEALLQALKDQQAATDRAVEEAVRRTNEQAARERLEMQKSMEKMLQEALARQNALIEAGNQKPGSQATSQNDTSKPLTEPASASSSISATQPPVTVAVVGTHNASATENAGGGTAIPSSSAEKGIELGQVFEYIVNDRQWGKQRKITSTVKAVTKDGILEEIRVDGGAPSQAVFGSDMLLIPAGVDAGMVVALHLNAPRRFKPGQVFRQIPAPGVSDCISGCEISADIVGEESLTISGKPLSTLRIDFAAITASTQTQYKQSRKMSAWYALDNGRLVRQVTVGYPGIVPKAINETVELSGINLP